MDDDTLGDDTLGDDAGRGMLRKSKLPKDLVHDPVRVTIKIGRFLRIPLHDPVGKIFKFPGLH